MSLRSIPALTDLAYRYEFTFVTPPEMHAPAMHAFLVVNTYIRQTALYQPKTRKPSVQNKSKPFLL